MNPTIGVISDSKMDPGPKICWTMTILLKQQHPDTCANEWNWFEMNRWMVRRKSDNLRANISASILHEHNQQWYAWSNMWGATVEISLPRDSTGHPRFFPFTNTYKLNLHLGAVGTFDDIHQLTGSFQSISLSGHKWVSYFCRITHADILTMFGKFIFNIV